MTPAIVDDLGGYLRAQRKAAKLSVRQLSELAGISNPYLSQIERGLKKPSAEILQQLARGLRISSESLYVRAGILADSGERGADVQSAIQADPLLTERQRAVLIEVYRAFVEEPVATAPAGKGQRSTTHPAQDGPCCATDGRAVG